MNDWTQMQWTPEGSRLHLQRGPMDLVVKIWGEGRQSGYSAAKHRFDTILDELPFELEKLRLPADRDRWFCGSVANRMHKSSCLALPEFVTPMAAVAGAVTDEIAGVIGAVEGVSKAYVNNGGDAAVVLNNDASLEWAIAGADAKLMLYADTPIRGIATSGWRGRSLSFGIADTVTVVGASSAVADVAATLIANHVSLPGHREILTRPAVDVSDDSELGERQVTVHVGTLSDAEIKEALARGVQHARTLVTQMPIYGVFLTLKGQWRSLGLLSQVAPDRPVAASFEGESNLPEGIKTEVSGPRKQPGDVRL